MQKKYVQVHTHTWSKFDKQYGIKELRYLTVLIVSGSNVLARRSRSVTDASRLSGSKQCRQDDSGSTLHLKKRLVSWARRDSKVYKLRNCDIFGFQEKWRATSYSGDALWRSHMPMWLICAQSLHVPTPGSCTHKLTTLKPVYHTHHIKNNTINYLTSENIQCSKHGPSKAVRLFFAAEVKSVHLSTVAPLMECWCCLVVLEALENCTVNDHLRCDRHNC